MTSIVQICALAVLPLTFSANAQAQAFNIDIQPTGADLPIFNYGAGAGQQGFWTEFDPENGPTVLNLASSNTPSGVSVTTSAFMNSLLQTSNAGSDSDLFDDYARLAAPTRTFQFTGLAGGDYNVYVHAWCVSSGTSVNVLIPAATPPTASMVAPGGTWPGLASGLTFTQQTVTVPGTGNLNVEVQPSAEFIQCITGIQLVPVNPIISTSYCYNGPTQPALMDVVGMQSISANNITLVARGCPPSNFGFFIYGASQGSNPAYCGTNCIGLGAPIGRLPIAPISTLGEAIFPVDNSALPTGAPLFMVGTMNFQFFFREICGGGSSANFSDGVTITLVP